MTPPQSFPRLLLAAGIAVATGCSPGPGRARAPQPDPAPQEVVFEHVRVLAMDGGSVLEDHSVLIRGDRIASVAPAAGFVPPAGAMRIDGRGATLVPGLADLHVHLYSQADLLNYLAHGVTTVLDLNGSARALAWRAGSRHQRAPAPTIYVAGPALNGYPPGNPSFVALDDPRLAAREVRRQHAAGYDLVKTYSVLAPQVYEAVLETAADEDMAVVGHIPLLVGLDRALAAGQRMIAHGEEFWKVARRADSAGLDAVLDATSESGAWVTPNLSAIDRIIAETADLPALLAAPEAEFMSPAAYSEWIPSNNRYWRADTSGLSRLRAELAFIQDITGRFSKRGVPLLVGTDSPVVGFAGASTHRELALLVEAGLTPHEALTAATRAAGEFVGETIGSGDRFGRIAPGYRADLLLVDGDPLADVSALRRMRGVMARGVWHTADELHTLRQARRGNQERLRSRVLAIDDLVAEGRSTQAIELYEATLTEYPESDLIAEVVLWTWGRSLLRDGQEGAATARRLFRAAVRAYPASHVGWVGLADASVAANDTMGARDALAHALELSPSDAGIRDRMARLEAAGQAPRFSVAGVYALRTRANVGGELRDVELVLTLEEAGAGWRGRIETDTPLPQLEATSVLAGKDRLWVSAPVDGRSLDLRLTVDGDDVYGSWNLGSSEQGLVRGTRTTQ